MRCPGIHDGGGNRARPAHPSEYLTRFRAEVTDVDIAGGVVGPPGDRGQVDGEAIVKGTGNDELQGGLTGDTTCEEASSGVTNASTYFA